jgi:predicted small secreted protein
MEEVMRKALARGFVALILLSGAATALSACNTTEGVGKDMSAGGNAISNSAEKNK